MKLVNAALSRYRHPIEIADFGREALAMNVRYLGVCCGAGPHHIRALAEAVGKHPQASRYSADMSKHAFLGSHERLKKVQKKVLKKRETCDQLLTLVPAFRLYQRVASNTVRSTSGRSQFSQVSLQPVRRSGKDGETVELMIAIRPPPQDMQEEIDLGRCGFGSRRAERHRIPRTRPSRVRGCHSYR